MILVDSSAFIEYYRPAGDPRVQAAVEAAIREDEVAVNGLIRVEIIAFAPDEAQRTKLESDFSAFHWLRLDRRHFERATELGFDLRRQGVTIPATELVIAASALLAGTLLYHADRHFDLVARHSELQARNLAG